MLPSNMQIEKPKGSDGGILQRKENREGIEPSKSSW